MRNVTTLLFDLGGVLIELGPFRQMLASSPLDDGELRGAWVASSSVRRFESGQCSAQEFANGIVEEFRLSVTPAVFLKHFNGWPTGAFDDADSLLASLTPHFQLACLSNTNHSHFQHVLNKQPMMERFSHTFFSFEMGIMKPAADAFEHAIQVMQLNPENVLFFDDSAANIHAARATGMNAEQVVTPAGVQACLGRLGLI
jgi:FMN phosphatase YigB (HAD superfamily)